jgi:hypothetical protein
MEEQHRQMASDKGELAQQVAQGVGLSSLQYEHTNTRPPPRIARPEKSGRAP